MYDWITNYYSIDITSTKPTQDNICALTDNESS